MKDAWVRGVVPAQKTTGAFMTLTSTEEVKVVAASTPVAKMTEIHASSSGGGIMSMFSVESLVLPAGKPVELKPGGHHVMLMELVRPLKDGESVPITLTLQDAKGKRTSVEVNATVRPLGR